MADGRYSQVLLVFFSLPVFRVLFFGPKAPAHARLRECVCVCVFLRALWSA